MSRARTPYLSAVICTLDRYPDLEHCLDALTTASRATKVAHEILVIDQTEPPSRRHDLSERFPRVRHVFQNDRGLSAARNLGSREALGEVIAYLDDDAVPCGDWFTEIAAPFKARRADRILACGGKVVADYRKGTKPAWMTRALEAYLSCVDWGDVARPIKRGEWIVGANMAFRREVFDQIDLFDVALGRKGTKTLLSNEEVSLVEKIGIEHIWYAPAALVNHVIGPERMEQRWFRRRVYWQAVSDLLADIDWMTPQQSWADVSGFLTAAPAELRSLVGLFHDCTDAGLFDRQLKAIYGLTMLGAGGFVLPE